MWNLDDDFFNAAAERAVKEAREERRAKRAAKKKKSQAAKKEVAALKAAMAEQDEVIRKLTEEIKKVTEVGARDRVTDWWNGPEASTPTAPAAKRTTRAPSFNIDDESGPELQIFDQGGKTWVPV